jgi:putative transcriptional regulator
MTEQLGHDELLMAHAAGRLPEPLALVVATHLALSPAARERYGRFEALGGVFLDETQPTALAADSWDRLLARLDDEPAATRPGGEEKASESRLPRPLRDYLPGPLESLRWRNYGTAAEYELPLRTPGFRTTLINVRAGKRVPRHTHEGNELTVVLEGAFHDATGRYRRGDLAIADRSIDHRPTAEKDRDCLCLAVTDAPLRLTGPFGRLLNPFLRF